MRDFLPAEKAAREHALGVIRQTYAAHGFDEIETPVVEDYDRLHSGLGGDNEKLGFSVLKRGLSHDDLAAASAAGDPHALADLGLRFDLTVPLARYYATHRAELPGVFRAMHVGPVWRAERPQKGRYRQFVQCDIDIVGDATPLAEVELITATSAALVALGLADCTIRLNDRRILAGILHWCGFATERFEQVLISVDKLDKIGVAGVVTELAEFGADSAAVLGGLLDAMDPALATGGISLTTEAILAVLPEGIDPDAVAALEILANALAHLPSGVTVVFDPTLVRGMGYYTSTIFEISHPASGSSIGGGGRYDGMIGRFLGEDVPAVGFSLGFERIIDLIPAVAAPSDGVVLIHEPVLENADGALAALMNIKAELVGHGKRVRLERRVKNLAPVLERARLAGFTSFAVVAENDRTRAELTFKDLTVKPLE
jgi:histidyl-tRNA synthetase